jgi:protein-export membrane protein SecD
MNRGEKIKIALVIVVLFLSLIYALPNLGKGLPAFLRRILPDKKLNLGLDLQGGIHTVLQVDINVRGDDPEWQRDAMQRALEIIRNRVDQFGIAEPSIQQQGKDKIIVQLPGIKDPARARELIGRMAKLEFKLVAEEDEEKKVIKKIEGLTLAEEEQKLPKFSELLYPLSKFEKVKVIREKDLPLVRKYLKKAREEKLIPPRFDLLLGKIEEKEIKMGPIKRLERVSSLYLVHKEASITGDDLEMARWEIGSNPEDFESYNKPIVLLFLNRRGAKKFARLTKEYKGKKSLAIVLDDKVYSAPFIRDEIKDGNARITGGFTQEEANDLAIVLRAGALPAPVKIIENRSVGPSLGQDSIRKGLLALIWGTILVIAFMIFYYQLPGVVAIFVLFLNLMIMVAILTGLGATLTLPGIAGIVLTVGMAVDANVLIFERIREERRHGRPLRASIQTGFSRAFKTILDANLTTLIAAFILFEFGTGPVKGFAVTLSIGLLSTMFTAILITRMILDFLSKREMIKLNV